MGFIDRHYACCKRERDGSRCHLKVLMGALLIPFSELDPSISVRVAPAPPCPGQARHSFMRFSLSDASQPYSTIPLRLLPC